MWSSGRKDAILKGVQVARERERKSARERACLCMTCARPGRILTLVLCARVCAVCIGCMRGVACRRCVCACVRCGWCLAAGRQAVPRASQCACRSQLCMNGLSGSVDSVAASLLTRENSYRAAECESSVSWCEYEDSDLWELLVYLACVGASESARPSARPAELDAQ
jgi:hypothetical protein